MPYIKQERREVYKDDLTSALRLLREEPDGRKRLQMVAWFAKKFLGLDDTYSSRYSFGQGDFNAVLAGNLYDVVCRMQIKTNQQSLEDQAGEYNYIISAICWSIIEDGLGKYFHRTFLKGMLHSMLEDQTLTNTNLIRVCMIRGVITDVIDEMYRRQTAKYEDSKITENGDVLPLFKKNLTKEEISQDQLRAEFS